MSWRKKGGVTRADSINNINVNTIVADTLTLKDYYYGNFEILGNIRASGSVEIESNLIANYVGAETILANTSLKVLKTATIYGNAAIKRDTYLYDRVIYGNIEGNTNVLTFFRNDNFGNFYIDQAKIANTFLGVATEYFEGKFGINNGAPEAALDIFSGLTKVLDVKSNSDVNYNILARNVNNTGVVLYTDNTSSSVRFFNETEIDGNEPDAILEYLQGGKIYLDVSGDTVVHSQFVVSNRDEEEHIMGETAVIYDPSYSSPLLYDTYEIDEALGGQALTMVAYDNSSATIMNMITPNKKGFTVVGGAFPYDATKSMGLLGTMDHTGKYTPTISITSTDNHLYYKNTVGINTNYPKLGDRAMDINGKIFVRNSEITLTTHTDFEILNYFVPRQYPNYSIALGTPYTILGDADTIQEDSDGNTITKNFQQKVYYSNDYCRTWHQSDFNNTDIGLIYNVFNGVYVVDENLSFVGANYGVVYFTNNGGETWHSVSSVPQNININSIHVIDIANNRKRVYLVGNQRIYWFDVNNSIYDAEEGINSTDIASGGFVYSNFIATKAAGTNNFLYIIGRTVDASPYHIINKHNIAGIISSIPAIRYESTNRRQYNAISVFDDNTVIAVGNSIITYTTTGGLTGWTDLIYDIDTGAYSNLNNVIFNNIYVFNETRAIAVGYTASSTLLLYCNTDYDTWNQLSTDFLRDAGAPDSVLSSTKISNVFITDLDNIQFTNVLEQYDFEGGVRGSSSIFNCYAPTVFNEENNFVINASGGLMIQGNAEITQNLLVKQTAIIQDIIVPGEAIVDTLTITGNIFAEELTLTGNTVFPALLVTGTITGNDIDVAGNAMLGKLHVLNGATMDTLQVTEQAQIADLEVTDVLSANKLYVTDVSAGEVFVNYGLSANILDVYQTATIQFVDASDANVDGLTNTRSLNVKETALIKDMTVSGHTIMNTVYGSDVSLNRLFVEADASLNQLRVYNHSLMKDTTVTDTLDAYDILAFGHTALNTLSVANDSVLNDLYASNIYNENTYVLGETTTDTFIAYSDASSANLFVSGNTQLNKLNVRGLSTMSHTNTTGNVNITGNLTVSEQTALNVLNVSGQSTTADISSANVKVYGNQTVDLTADIGDLNVSRQSNLHNTRITGTLTVDDVRNTNSITTSHFASSQLAEMNRAVVYGDASMAYIFTPLGEATDLYVNNIAGIEHLLVYTDANINELYAINYASLPTTDISETLTVAKKTATNELYVDICANTLDLYVNRHADIANANVSGNAAINRLFAVDASINRAVIADASASQLFVTNTVRATDAVLSNNVVVMRDISGNNNVRVGENLYVRNTSQTDNLVALVDASVNRLFVSTVATFNQINANDISTNTLVVQDACANTLYVAYATADNLIVNYGANVNGYLNVANGITADYLDVFTTGQINQLNATSAFVENMRVYNDAVFDSSVNSLGLITQSIVARDLSANSFAVLGGSISTDLTVGRNASIIGNTTVSNLLTTKDAAVSGNAVVARATIADASINTLHVLNRAVFDVSVNAPSVYASSLMDTPLLTATNIATQNLVASSRLTTADLSANNDVYVGRNAVVNANLSADNVSVAQRINTTFLTATDISSTNLTVRDKLKAGVVDASGIIATNMDVLDQLYGNTVLSNFNVSNDMLVNSGSYLNNVYTTGDHIVYGNSDLGYTKIFDASINVMRSNQANIAVLRSADASFSTAVINAAFVKDIVISGTAFIQNIFYPYKLITPSLDITQDISTNHLAVWGKTHTRDVDVSGNILMSGLLNAKDLVASGNAAITNLAATTGNINALTASSITTTTLAATTATLATVNATNIAASGNVNGNNATLSGLVTANRASVDFLNLANGLISGGDASFGNVFVGGSFKYTSIVSSETTLQGNTDVSNISIVGNTNVNDLYSSGNTFLNTLSVSTKSAFHGDLSANGQILSYGNARFFQNATVLGDASFNRNVFVVGNTTTAGTAIMLGDASFNGNIVATRIHGSGAQPVLFTGDASFGNAMFGGNLVSSSLAILRDVSLNGNLVMGGNATYRNRLNVFGDASFTNMNVFGTSVFNQLAVANADVSLNRALITQGNATMRQQLFVLGDTSLNRLFVNNATVSGDASFGRLTTTQPAKLSTAEILGDASFNGNMNVVDGAYIGQNYYQFKNTSQVVRFPPFSTAGMSTITISFWAQIGRAFTSISNPIITYNGSNFLETRSTGVWAISNTSSPIRTYGISTGRFQHHVYVITVGADPLFNVYLDNTQMVSFTSTTTYISSGTSNIFAFGPMSSTGDLACDLRIRDFRIYNTGLSETDVSSLYAGTYTNTANLLFRDAALPFNNLKTNVYSNMYVASDTYLNQNVFISGDASLNGNVAMGNTRANSAVVLGDASLNSALYVNGNTILNGRVVAWADVSLNTLNVSNITNLLGNVSVSKQLVAADASFNRRVFIGGNTQISQGLVVLGDGSLNNAFVMGNTTTNILTANLFTARDASLNGGLDVANNAIIRNNATVNGDASLNRLFVSRTAVLNGGVVASGDASLNGRLYVGGTSQFSQKVDVTGDVSMTNLYVSGIAYLKNVSMQYSMNGDASFNGTLMVQDNSTLYKNLTVWGDASANSLFVSGASRVRGNMGVSGDASFNTNVLVLGNTTLNRLVVNTDLSANSLLTTGLVRMNGGAVMGGDASLNRSLAVGGNAWFNQRADIVGDTSLNALTVNGVSLFRQNIIAQRDISLNGALNVLGNANLRQNVSVIGDMSLNGALVCGGNAAVNSSLTVSQDTVLNTLTAVGNATVRGDLRVWNNTVLERNVVIGDNNRYYQFNDNTSSITYSAVDFTGRVSGQYFSISLWVYISNSFNPTNASASALVKFNGTILIEWNATNSKFVFASSTDGFTVPRERFTHVYLSLPTSISATAASANTLVFINNELVLNKILTTAYVRNVLTTFSTGPFTTTDSTKIFIRDFRIFGSGHNIDTINKIYARTYVNDPDYTLAHYPLTSTASTTSSPNTVVPASTATLNNISFAYVYSTATEMVSDAIVRGNIAANGAVDMSGNLTVGGTKTTVNALSVSNTLNVVGDVSLNGNSVVGRNSNILGGLNVFGDASMNGSLVVRGVGATRAITALGDVSLNGLFTVIGNTNMRGNIIQFGGNYITDGSLNVGGNAFVNGSRFGILGDASLNRILTVGGNTILGQRLEVFDDVSFNRNAAILGNTNVRGRLDVSGNIWTDASLNVRGNASVLRDIFVGGDASLNGNLFANKNATIFANATVGGNAILNGNLGVSKNTNMGGQLLVSGDASFNNRLSVFGTTYFDRLTIINGDLSLNGVFRQAGTVGYDSINVNQDLSINRFMTVGGNSRFRSDLTVDAATNLFGPLVLGGTATLAQNVRLFGDLSMNGTFGTFGNIFANRKLTVIGDASFNSAFFSGDASFNRTLYIGDVATIAGNIEAHGNLNIRADIRGNANLVIDKNTVLKGNTNIDKWLVVTYDASLSSLYSSGTINNLGGIFTNSRIATTGDASFNGNLDVGTNGNILGNLNVVNQTTTKDLSVTGNLLLKGNNLFTTTNNWSGKNNFADVSLNNLNVVQQLTSPNITGNYLNLLGATITDDATVDTVNETNTYLRLGPNGSAKWSYLRQIETGLKYKVAWDYHNDNSLNMVFRSVNSSLATDSAPLTRFEIANGSIGLNGANIDHTNGGVFLPNGDAAQKIVLSSAGATNEFQQHRMGVAAKQMVMNVPASDSSFVFQYGVNSTSSAQFAVLGNGGLDVRTGNLMLGGTNVFDRTNTWTGRNIFTNDLSANSKTITPTQFGYLSDLSLSLLDALNSRPLFSQILNNSNTWTQQNTFNQTVSFFGTLESLSTTSSYFQGNIRANSGIFIGTVPIVANMINRALYFQDNNQNRKIVLFPSTINVNSVATSGESTNHSIGVNTNGKVFQFMMPASDCSYAFSYGTGASVDSKADIATIDLSGIKIPNGNLFIGTHAYDASLVHLFGNETIAGNKTFTGTVSGITATMVGLGSVDNTSDAIKPISTATQTALNEKATDTAVVHLTGTETITGAKLFNADASFNRVLRFAQLSSVYNATAPAYRIIDISNNVRGINSRVSLVNDGSLVLTNYVVRMENSANAARFDYNPTADFLRIYDVSFSSGRIGVNNTFVSAAELSYLNGATSNIQSQIGNKANDADVVKLTGDQTINGTKTISGNFLVNSKTVTPTQFSYLSDFAGTSIKSYIDTNGGTLLLSSNNTWTGRNIFTNDLSANNKTITPTQLSYLSDFTTSSIKNYVDTNAGTALLAANNTWTGINTFTANLSANSKTITPTQLSYLSDFTTTSIKGYVDASAGIINASNTWTGARNTFMNDISGNRNVLVGGSIGLGEATIDLPGTICFPNTLQNRKIVLYRMSGNDYQNYSIGIQNTTMQFLVNETGAGFTFSAAISSTAKKDYMRIDNNGVNLITGNLLLNGANIFARDNTWSGINTFTNNLSANSKTITPTQLGHLSDFTTTSIKGYVDASAGILNANNRWSGINTFANNLSANNKTITPTQLGHLSDFTTTSIKGYVDASAGILNATNVWTGRNVFGDASLVLQNNAILDVPTGGIKLGLSTVYGFKDGINLTAGSFLNTANILASVNTWTTTNTFSGNLNVTGTLQIGGTNILARNNTWSGTNSYSGNLELATNGVLVLKNGTNKFQFNGIYPSGNNTLHYVPSSGDKHSFRYGTGNGTDVEVVAISGNGLTLAMGDLIANDTYGVNKLITRGEIRVCVNNANTYTTYASLFTDSTPNFYIQRDTRGSTGVFLANSNSWNSWNTVSDRRLKENINDINGSLKKINELRPVKYNFIGRNTHNVGFIAQEVEEIIPEVVTEGGYNETLKDKTKGLSMTDMIPFIVDAIREQSKIVQSQKEEIQSQKEEIQSQKEEIQSLKQQIAQINQALGL